MGSVSVDDFMVRVLNDEGWMEPLSGDMVTRVIQRLEAALPPGAQLNDARAEQLRKGLRELAVLAGALSAGKLDESTLVEGCLGLLEV